MDLKPGYQTSEFAAVAASFVAAVAVVAVAFHAPLTPDQQTAIVDAVGPSCAFVAAAYALARTFLKVKALDAATYAPAAPDPAPDLPAENVIALPKAA